MKNLGRLNAKNVPLHLRHLIEPSREQPYPRDASLKLDKKIDGLTRIYNCFGSRAVEAVLLGLSRPFNATTEDVDSLIDQWKRRDPRCCYQGTHKDIFETTDTMVFAISYRHAEMDQFEREGPGRVCKFTTADESLFKAAITALSATYPQVMVWCDQIISTRFSMDDKTPFEWYHVGLLPYMAFEVLYLSTESSEETLERRTWIRAERSLARMGNGYLSADDACRKISTHRSGQGKSGTECMKNLCKHILSGYWPEPSGDYWKQDYHCMKTWALGVLCRGSKAVFNVPLFEEHDPVDNNEILSNMGELALIPDNMEEVEPVAETDDKEFFLKATAWNLSIRTEWEEHTSYISHFMGRMGDQDTQFSWWHCDSINMLFGFLISNSRATRIVAVENKTGYRVTKSKGSYFKYNHAARIAGPEMKEQVLEAARMVRIELDPDLEWKLLYSSDSDSLNDRTVVEIRQSLKEEPSNETITLPDVYRGMTTNLFKSAVARPGGHPAQVARTIFKCVEDWNEYVKKTYDHWHAVKDTTSGPVWLEGFNEKEMSFGFLEFLTEILLFNKRCIPEKVIPLGKIWGIEQDLRTRKQEMEENELCLADELLTHIEGSSIDEVIQRDVALYIICGGFTKGFIPKSFLAFAKTYALAKGYWFTTIVCWSGEMQIRFIDASGQQRIAQRRTTLPDYSARGLVDPRDYEEVKKISIPHDTAGEDHKAMVYWKYKMSDTTTRDGMWMALQHSKRVRKNKEVLLADMTVGVKEESRLAETQNIFASGMNPFWMMSLAQTGEAADFFRRREEIIAMHRERAQEMFSNAQASSDRRRDLERNMQQDREQNPNNSQSSEPESPG